MTYLNAKGHHVCDSRCYWDEAADIDIEAWNNLLKGSSMNPITPFREMTTFEKLMNLNERLTKLEDNAAKTPPSPPSEKPFSGLPR